MLLAPGLLTQPRGFLWPGSLPALQEVYWHPCCKLMSAGKLGKISPGRFRLAAARKRPEIASGNAKNRWKEKHGHLTGSGGRKGRDGKGKMGMTGERFALWRTERIW